MYKPRNLTCFWCGRGLVSSRDASNPLRLTRDHFPARVNRRDFPFLPQCIVFACFECNNSRGTDDGWIPFAWYNAEQQERILVEGTPAVLEFNNSNPAIRRILSPELYQFIADIERG